jgi:hypothetical protein
MYIIVSRNRTTGSIAYLSTGNPSGLTPYRDAAAEFAREETAWYAAGNINANLPEQIAVVATTQSPRWYETLD